MGLRLLTKLAFELSDTFFWKCCQEVLLAVLETLQDESAHSHCNSLLSESQY